MTGPRTADPRTDLRDARLHKALAHAPDADALPAPSTRITIKNIAASAMPTEAKAEFESQKPWWKRYWEKAGRAGIGGHAASPWNAAFATLLLGGIITLIWHGQPVPDAVLDERPPPHRVPDAASPGLTVKPPVPIAVPAPMPAPAPAPLPAPAPPATTAAAKADSSASAGAALRREAPMVEKRESTAGGAASADKAIGDAPAAPQQARTPGAAAAPSTADRAGSVAERIARNDSNNRSRTASFGAAAMQPGEWAAADVLYQGRTTRLTRLDAQNLVSRALALAGANPAPQADGEGGAPVLRLQLLGPGGRVAVAQFDLWGSHAFRWQRAGQTDVAGLLTPEAAEGLLADAARALPP